MTKPTVVTVSLTLTYDAWRDLEGALLERAITAHRNHHEAMADRLNAVRHDVEAQVHEQKPRWR